LHELAKELGVPSKDLLALVREIGLNVKSHSSNLEAGEEAILRYAMNEILEEKQKELAPAAEAEAEEAEKEADEAQVATAEEADEAEAAPAAAVEEEAPAEAAAAEEPVEAKEEESEPVAVGEEAAKEEDAEKTAPAKPVKKLKKIAKKKKAGATILGRIDLSSVTLEQHRKAREQKRKDQAEPKPRVAAEHGTQEDDRQTVAGKKTAIGRTPAAVGRPGTFADDKISRTIKPKQGPDQIDLEDPLLQEIRINHWAKHYRPRRPVFRGHRGHKKATRPAPVVDRKAQIEPPVSVKVLSQETGIKAQNIMMSLLKKGIMININSLLDEEQILQIAIDFNKDVEIIAKKDVEETFFEEEQVKDEVGEGKTVQRAPIVTFLGHVDHGKTSLLDAIRKSNVVSTEEGGITQHISAYQVKTKSGLLVTFLDTPGHKAFTEMRARGANATDIAVLVVAADDGVMPQTEEAIQHAQAAGVPLVVAINKIDKPNANPDMVRQRLSGVGVMTEDWGGEVGCVEVSAIKKTGIDELLDRLSLEAEILELECNPSRKAKGVVIESWKDEEIGNVVTLLVQDGAFGLKENILAGDSTCRVRTILDERGKRLETAGPSTPVNVVGFESLPEAGEPFQAVEDVDKAKEIAELRRQKNRAKRLAPERQVITLENLFDTMQTTKAAEIRVVLKTDVKGSLEVIKKSFQELDHEDVKIKLIRDGVGGVTEDDVLLAIASEAIIIGFRVVADEKARRLIEENQIDFRTYRVIYNLIEEIHLAMEGALEPLKKEQVTAHVEIREVYRSSRIGNIAGCFVLDGVISRNNKVRLTRNGVVIYEGDIETLKRFKDDQREVKEGFECGVKIAGYDDIKVGDVIESYKIVEEKRKL